MAGYLFSPLRLRQCELENRIAVSPMCQYIATDGCMNDWHLMHLGQFAVSGTGLVMTEMTDVEPRGRIGPYCVGLYSDACEAAMRRVINFCREHGRRTRLGVQLSHAGRKSSILPPWTGRKSLPPEAGGWQPVAPSAIGVSADQPPPRALSIEEIVELTDKFRDAARRAERLGFDLIELHAAHGYLLHQFFSPLSNRREDQYGGSLDNRMRFALEVFAAMREVWPVHKPMAVKLSVLDWCEGGLTLDDSIELCRRLRDLGCDYVVVSSGGIVQNEKLPATAGFQVPLAAEIRRRAGLPTMAVGLITDPNQAEDVIASGQADLVALARGMLYNPRWAWHAADALGVDVPYPDQYARARPKLAHDTFGSSCAIR